MDIRLILKGNTPINVIGDLSKITDLNYEEIGILRDESDTYYNNKISLNDEVIEQFRFGDHWKEFKYKIRRGLVYNAGGESIYAPLEALTKWDKDLEIDKPKRQVNEIESIIQTLVANYVQTDPMPTSESPSDTNDDPDIKDKVDKNNLAYNTIFRIENDINSLNGKMGDKAYTYGSTFFQIVVDYERSKTNIPIKLKLINRCDIRCDYTTDNINESDYFFHKFKIRFWELKTKYNYKKELGDKDFKDSELVELEYWWFRFRAKDDKKGDPIIYWVKFVVFEKKRWLKPVNLKGEIDEKYVLDDMLYEELPYIKVKAFDDESSLVDKLISSQIMYNKVLSEQDWHLLKTVNRPIVCQGAETTAVKNGMIPNGAVYLKQGETMQEVTAGFVPSQEFDQIKNSIKNDMYDVSGNVGVLSGERQTGTYSDKQLQTIKKTAESKPQMVEANFLKALKEMARKSLYILKRHLAGKSITIYDPNKPKGNSSVTIYGSDLDYKGFMTEIDVKDLNLMNREAKFQLYTQFIQYTQQSPIYTYFMALMANNAIPHFIPEDLLKLLKSQYDMASQGQGTPGTTGQTPGVTGQQPNQSIGQTGTPTGQIQPQIPASTSASTQSTDQTDVEDVDVNDFTMQIENKMNELRAIGVPEPEVDSVYEKFIIASLFQGVKGIDLLMPMDEIVNKTTSIFGQGMSQDEEIAAFNQVLDEAINNSEVGNV